MTQSRVITQSSGQIETGPTPPISVSWNPSGSQTSPPGLPTMRPVHSGNQTQTGSPPPPAGNQSSTWSIPTETWTRFANQTWTGPANQTRTQMQGNWTWAGPSSQTWNQTLGNQTHVRNGLFPGLPSEWAQSNMTIGARNFTQPILLNGTSQVRLGYVAINSSSSEQTIRNIAFNGSIVQVELDHNGSLQLVVNSSTRPTHVYADNFELAQAQSTSGLSPESETWVYDQNTGILTIFADPSSITIIYGSVATPVPEFSVGFELVLIVSLALGAIVPKRQPSRKDQVGNFPMIISDS